MIKPLKTRIIEVRGLLQADEEEMARHLRLSVDDYKAIERGARVLPLSSRRTLEKRLQRLLDICGLK